MIEPEWSKASSQVLMDGQKNEVEGGNAYSEAFEELTNDRSDTFTKRVAKDISDSIEMIWDHDGNDALGEEGKDFYDYIMSGLVLGTYEFQDDAVHLSE